MTSPRDHRDEHRDDDEVFRQIVAGFGDEPAEAVPRWPVSEDVGEEPGAPVEELSRDTPPGEEEGLPGWVEPAALEDEGHYEPPPPPRLPRLRPRTLGGLVLVLLGFAALLAPYEIGLDDSVGSLLLGMLLVVGGGTLLIGSMRDAPGSDDPPDDGAVV
ncbi:MAG TPA: hypothetical protein VMZ11_02955 [Mycobacteriales bacterium]|nr:hypothetical protein [Mycobacteriales bacterium]